MRVACAPSVPLPAPGVGRGCWSVELVRQRNGNPFSITLEACDDTGRLALPAAAADRATAQAGAASQAALASHRRIAGPGPADRRGSGRLFGAAGWWLAARCARGTRWRTDEGADCRAGCETAVAPASADARDGTPLRTSRASLQGDATRRGETIGHADPDTQGLFVGAVRVLKPRN